jgi:hypothetical protein
MTNNSAIYTFKQGTIYGTSFENLWLCYKRTPKTCGFVLIDISNMSERPSMRYIKMITTDGKPHYTSQSRIKYDGYVEKAYAVNKDGCKVVIKSKPPNEDFWLSVNECFSIRYVNVEECKTLIQTTEEVYKEITYYVKHKKWEAVEEVLEDIEEEQEDTCKDCSNKVSTIGLSEGDAPREYCEECYLKDQEEEESEDEDLVSIKFINGRSHCWDCEKPIAECPNLCSKAK